MATFSISAVARKAQATANGSTTQFAFSFSVNTEADVAVFVGTTLKTISTHYTVSITSSTGAGSITFTSGNTPSNGQIVTIMSKTALARSSVYTSGGTINATSLETDFDTNMMLFQQQDERLDRTLIAPVDDAVSIDMTLPNKDARKGKSLGFDGTSGNPTAIEQVTGAAVNVSTVSVGGSATASVAVSGGTATFALGIPTGATGATGPAGGGLAEVSSDSSPQLGGPLDVVTHDIVTTSNRDIELAPHGTGKTVLRGNTNPGKIVLNCESNSHGQTIIAQPHSASVTNTLTLPAGGDQTLVGTAGATFTGDVTVPDGDLILGSTAVTSTAAELNKLDALSRGSLIYGNASAATAVLTKGSANTFLKSDGTDIAWGTVSAGTAAIVFPSNWASPTNNYTSSGTWSKGSLADDDYVWFYLVNSGGGGGNARPGHGGRAMLLYGTAATFNGAAYTIGAAKAGSSDTGATVQNPTTVTLSNSNGSIAFTAADLAHASDASGSSSLQTNIRSIDGGVAGTYLIGAPTASYAINTGSLPTNYGLWTVSSGIQTYNGDLDAVFAGGVGYSNFSSVNASAVSLFAGNGGASNGAAGAAPGGGGAETSGGTGAAGAAGSVRVYHV